MTGFKRARQGAVKVSIFRPVAGRVYVADIARYKSVPSLADIDRVFKRLKCLAE